MVEITREQVQSMIQFTHPIKTLRRMPGASEALDDNVLASLFGLSRDDYRAIVQQFDNNARSVAEDLLTDTAFAGMVDHLPFAPGSTVAGLGDSITDDLQSWLEILRHLLALRRPDDDIRVINAGISGETTAQVIARFFDLTLEKPDWIICMIGTNDARLHGTSPVKTLISIEETENNLDMLRAFAANQTDAQWVWMTPARAIEDWTANDWQMSTRQVMWHNEDLAAVAERIRRQPDPVVDLQSVFNGPDLETLLLPDGLHPNLNGQRAIVTALVERLTSVTRRT